MGWETRERGSSYYTRSKWKGGQVVRQYVGTGPLAELIALDDELKRCQKEEEATYWREERERLEQSVGFLRELEEAAEVLTQAELLACGCHQRKGQWRRRRGV
jgi:hypothetical protein